MTADPPPDLDQTAPDRVVIYMTDWCAYCMAAKRFLRDVKGVEPVLVDLTGDHEARVELARWTGLRTVPQIFIGKTHVGGYDEMRSLDRRGGLDPLLEAVKATQ